jgi:hypothetical protein
MTLKRLVGVGFCAAVFAGASLAGVMAHNDHADTAPSPVGSWFGVAHPCTPDAGLEAALGYVEKPGTEDANICKNACKLNTPAGVCPTSQFPVPEVTMIPTIGADNTVTAYDFAEMIDHHTIAQGRWDLTGRTRIDPFGKQLDRYQASFIWFQSRTPTGGPISIYGGAVRPRFVTFFDDDNPDVMRGFIQPYAFPYTDNNGFVILKPGTPFPLLDPIKPLPTVCDPTVFDPTQPHCFGTLHFVIRRTPSH